MNVSVLARRGPDPGAVRMEPAAAGARDERAASTRFEEQWTQLFDAHYARLFRYLDRLSGDPDLAADLVQETFIRLYRRNTLPDRPEAWLITVALNLFRNVRSTVSRRARLLSVVRAIGVHSDPPVSPGPSVAGAGAEPARRVREALATLPEREQNLLLLRAEGFSYHDIASALGLNEASVGTLLARARNAFCRAFEADDAH